MSRASSLNRLPPGAKNITKKTIPRTPSLNISPENFPEMSNHQEMSSRQHSMNFLGNFNRHHGPKRRSLRNASKKPPTINRNSGFSRPYFNYHSSNHKTPGFGNRVSSWYQSRKVKRQDQDYEKYKRKLAKEIELAKKEYEELVRTGQMGLAKIKKEYLDYLLT